MLSSPVVGPLVCRNPHFYNVLWSPAHCSPSGPDTVLEHGLHTPFGSSRLRYLRSPLHESVLIQSPSSLHLEIVFNDFFYIHKSDAFSIIISDLEEKI